MNHLGLKTCYVAFERTEIMPNNTTDLSQLNIILIQLLLHDLLQHLERESGSLFESHLLRLVNTPKHEPLRRGYRPPQAAINTHLVESILQALLRRVGTTSNCLGVVSGECSGWIGVVSTENVSWQRGLEG